MSFTQKHKTDCGVSRVSDFQITKLVEHGGSMWTIEQLFRMVSGVPRTLRNQKKNAVVS
uniref:Uncharacterized protein n=1 Tax=Bacillus phage Adastra TaxID=3143958 RepID=A0AAU8BBD9_9CAUD